MLVTLFGMVMLVKDLHLQKDFSPMLVTDKPPSSDGMVTAPDGAKRSVLFIVAEFSILVKFQEYPLIFSVLV